MKLSGRKKRTTVKLVESLALEGRTKKEAAAALGVARSTLYYKRKIPSKDATLLEDIRHTLHLHPSYGYRRLALALNVNTKRIRRVMRINGVKPYRRRACKPVCARSASTATYPNLIKGWFPEQADVVWVSDFTYLAFRGRFVFVATVEDLYSRKVVGWHISTSHDTALTTAALFHALTYHRAPKILHSDHGSEYTAFSYIELAARFSIQISMSRKASPWENGYQESFFSQFKVDLGDPNRYNTLGELTEYIHLRVYIYNTYRIHSALKTSPLKFLGFKQPERLALVV